MKKLLRPLAIAMAASSLPACAGYHSVPPANYSTVLEGRIERVVFDQDGDPYPRSNDPAGLTIPAQPPNKNKAFKLRRYYNDLGLAYDPDALIDQSANRIIAGMRATNAKRVVFLIKGFNNSYQSSDAEYEWMRDEVLAAHQMAGLFIVQVYWDAIYRGKGTAPGPVAYFADSLTYSNHAGDCGLRAILRRLPPETDVTFLTHSRGAAVALSALADPKYDEGISNNCKSINPGNELPDQLGDVRLVAFAPAIGDGHVRESRDVPRKDIFDRLDRFYVGYNPNDPAVTKKYFGINLSDRYGGDTRLGGNESYITHLDKLFLEANLGEQFQTGRFDRHSHDWQEYIALKDQAHCLLWAGKLVSKKPQVCDVSL